MVLEGVVTNVTKFGAFVGIGVHQDGLVHISELSNRYVKDASEIVKAGQIVKVTVLSADPRTKRLRNIFLPRRVCRREIGKIVEYDFVQFLVPLCGGLASNGKDRLHLRIERTFA
jgi:translation initiation factor 2 alpha subunit (eIF-2alpha)